MCDEHVLIGVGGAANIYRTTSANRTTSATEQPGDREETNNLARSATHDPGMYKKLAVSEKKKEAS